MVRLARILVPVDFSPSCDAAVEEALFLARRLGAAVDLLHVRQSSPRPEDDSEASLASFARSDVGHEMRQYLERAEQEGVAAQGRLDYGDPEEIILASADDYDLIVMGTRGRGGVSHVLRPSVAEHVVRRANIPVLTIHAPVAAAMTGALAAEPMSAPII